MEEEKRTDLHEGRAYLPIVYHRSIDVVYHNGRTQMSWRLHWSYRSWKYFFFQRIWLDEIRIPLTWDSHMNVFSILIKDESSFIRHWCLRIEWSYQYLFCESLKKIIICRRTTNDLNEKELLDEIYCNETIVKSLFRFEQSRICCSFVLEKEIRSLKKIFDKFDCMLNNLRRKNVHFLFIRLEKRKILISSRSNFPGECLSEMFHFLLLTIE